MSDKKMADLARKLAEALLDAAYTPSPEDKKRITNLHIDICRTVREEVEAETE